VVARGVTCGETSKAGERPIESELQKVSNAAVMDPAAEWARQQDASDVWRRTLAIGISLREGCTVAAGVGRVEGEGPMRRLGTGMCGEPDDANTKQIVSYWLSAGEDRKPRQARKSVKVFVSVGRGACGGQTKPAAGSRSHDVVGPRVRRLKPGVGKERKGFGQKRRASP